ncbi:MAG: pyridoxal phosphate-dependent aminotransferase, partial [Muribaculaceae bacterium]|nr:pyridoxal phosphate-dependent aminotransferase [Muribaculaceae bacterium]
VTPDDIIITTGGSEAVMFAFMVTLDPGDEVIIPEPAYANYKAFALQGGATIVSVPSSIDDGFRLPKIEEFERLITPRTKGICICSPNNPTGYIYTAEEMLKLRDLVKRYNLFLYSDEVYREFCYSDRHPVSALSLEGIEDNVIVIDSVSKRYNECGIRIGTLVTRNRALYANVMKFAQARLSPPLIGQLVALASIDVPQTYLDNAIDEYRHRRDFLVNGLNEIPGVFSPMPEGAFYTMARLPVENAEDFCRWCLTEFSYNGTTVFMAPGEGFYTTPGLGRDEVRIAYVHRIDALAGALECLRAALEAYRNR